MSQVFDERELLERVDQDCSFLRETVEMFATDGRELMQEISAALAAGDTAAVGRAAHTLKGMISNFCSPAAQASAFEVEKLGKGGDLSAAPEAVKELAQNVETLIGALNDFLATRT
jgi:two-component system, sensor histidine kinase and response regulator